jgi:hypothetical protein
VRLHPALALSFAAACRAPVWTAASPSGHTIEVQEAAGRHCVQSVLKRSRTCFDAVAVHSIAFDRGGSHVAYAARSAGDWTVVRDGTVGSRWTGVGAPRWSPDGSMLAHAAERDGRWHLVVDDSPGHAFDAILEHSIAFGRGRVGYAAKRGDSIHVVIDGRVSRGWLGAAHLTFDPAGVVAAFAARDQSGWHVVVGDSTSRVHDAIGAIALGFGGLAYVASDSGRVRVIEEGRQHRAYEEVQDLAWSRDTPVYLASAGDSSFIVRGGAIMDRGARGSLADVTVSPRGRLAWVAEIGDRMSVGDGVRRDTFDLVVEKTLQFVDGERLACLAGNRATRELFVVVDGRRVGATLAWSELVRWVRQPGGEDALRAWVAGAARLP